MAKARTQQLPDAAQRARIERDLDRNFMVEAAAGTGKTTSMVRRMVALVASAGVDVARIAALTFTRKAASELKVRFYLALEDALRDAVREGREAKTALLKEALDRSERCFIGTIHSFCARLCRERPVEAGVDPAFTEMDEAEDARLRRAAWEEQMTGLADESLRNRLLGAGLPPDGLFGLFTAVVEHPDVDSWPAPDPVPPDCSRDIAPLERYLAGIRALLPSLPAETGTDTLIPRLRKVHRMARNARSLADPLTLFRIFQAFEPGVTARHKFYPGGKEQALAELRHFEAFRDSVALPAVDRFMEYRYAVAIEAVAPAVERYRRVRHVQGSLNYEDLLIKAAGLLREHPHVRRFFQERYQRLLVDEFQDTDPVQAEVMMLLASHDPDEKDWRRCTPRPGALFVVGDPKQSIYRFRRADIAVYNEVRGILTGSGGGEILELSSNFRSRGEILRWVNEVFELCFPAEATDEAPRYVRLEPGREDPAPPDLCGVRTLLIPAEHGNKERVLEYEPDRIARTIRDLCDSKATVAGKDGAVRPCAYSDFLVVTMKKEHLSPFSAAFDRWGIPHQVSGGAALNGIPELFDLYLAVRSSARPHDPVALVAVLRSEMFGFSDADLLAYRCAGGEFRQDGPAPQGLDPVLGARFSDVFTRLARYAGWLATLPPVPAIERVAEDIGLPALAAVQPDGDLRAGSLYSAMEILRGAAARRPLLEHVLETFRLLVTGEEPHDGATVRPDPPSFARVMNLHKVKGLEAPVVFLAAPVGKWIAEPSLHIVRDGGTVAAYAEVAGPGGGWGRPPAAAYPPGWKDHWAVREKAFLEAEMIRLRYVAATRAGSMLVVSRLEGRVGDHPWTFFYDHLEDAPALPDPKDLEPPPRSLEKLGPDEGGDPAVYRGRWEGLREPTYSKGNPSSYSARGPDAQPAAGEHGTGWGTVVHKLLELVMRGPAADKDLAAAAATFLIEEGLDDDQADAAVRLVRSVAQSDIWTRALKAGTKDRFTEVPYTFLKSTDPLPALESGVMDLVFFEDGGWVIVDYKTGRRDPDKHRPQLMAYREAWEAMGCGKVREVGVYYVDEGEYAVVETTQGQTRG